MVWSVKEAVGSEKFEVWNVKCEVWSVKFKFGVRRAQCEVWSVKCEVWGLECEGSSEKWEVWSVDCEVWSVECEVWSVKFEVWSAKSAVWSVECEDFASSLAEKKSRLSREGHGRDRLSSNYRSFIFGKLPPPACPGTCIMYVCILFFEMLFELETDIQDLFSRFAHDSGSSFSCPHGLLVGTDPMLDQVHIEVPCPSAPSHLHHVSSEKAPVCHESWKNNWTRFDAYCGSFPMGGIRLVPSMWTYCQYLSIMLRRIIVPKKYWLVCLGIPTSWFVIIYQYIKGI